MVRRSRLIAGFAACASLACGCGEAEKSSEGEERALAWVEKPQVVESPTLPGEMIATGDVLNSGESAIELEVGEVAVISAGGRPLQSSAAFLTGFVKPVEGLNRPDTLEEEDLERLGRVATIGPGESVPLTVSWRAGESGLARSVQVGARTLPLP